jgi:hypothetical protein
MMGLRIARLAVGAVELLAPGRVATPVVRRKPDETELVVFQILGARHVVQGLFPRWLPAGRFATGPSLDVLHALSMVGVVAASERYRRLALGNIADALLFAAFATRG